MVAIICGFVWLKVTPVWNRVKAQADETTGPVYASLPISEPDMAVLRRSFMPGGNTIFRLDTSEIGEVTVQMSCKNENGNLDGMLSGARTLGCRLYVIDTNGRNLRRIH
jgi:hypothetical protein